MSFRSEFNIAFDGLRAARKSERLALDEYILTSHPDALESWRKQSEAVEQMEMIVFSTFFDRVVSVLDEARLLFLEKEQ